eukprot:1145532-Pelagomonas_calceolata.AAC.1
MNNLVIICFGLEDSLEKQLWRTALDDSFGRILWRYALEEGFGPIVVLDLPGCKPCPTLVGPGLLSSWWDPLLASALTVASKRGRYDSMNHEIGGGLEQQNHLGS